MTTRMTKGTARFYVSLSLEKETEKPWPLPLLQGEVRMDPGPRGRAGGGRRGGGNEENRDVDSAKEKDATWSFVSFSSEKEMKEPWPPPLL